MKITYISHSGFLVETAQMTLLFDYYQKQVPMKHIFPMRCWDGYWLEVVPAR